MFEPDCEGSDDGGPIVRGCTLDVAEVWFDIPFSRSPYDMIDLEDMDLSVVRVMEVTRWVCES